METTVDRFEAGSTPAKRIGSISNGKKRGSKPRVESSSLFTPMSACGSMDRAQDF